MAIDVKRKKSEKKEVGRSRELVLKKYSAQFEKVSFSQFAQDFIKAISDQFGDTLTMEDAETVYDSITIPKRATRGSAGYDFVTPIGLEIPPQETVLVPTGIRCLMRPETVLLLLPRSSMGFKYRMQFDNTVGVIDSDYYNADNEGHIMIKVTNDSKQDTVLSLNAGDNFAQGIFLQYGIACEEEVTASRVGGFGSTN